MHFELDNRKSDEKKEIDCTNGRNNKVKTAEKKNVSDGKCYRNHHLQFDDM